MFNMKKIMYYACTFIWITAGLLTALPLLGIFDALSEIFSYGDFSRFGQIVFTVVVAGFISFGAYHAAENWFRD